MPHLIFFRRAQELMTIRARNGLLVGRDPACDAHVPDPAVSRHQFQLLHEDDRWFLLDRSGRGTDVAGKLEARAELLDGLDIGLGKYRAMFMLSDPASSAEADTLVGDGEGTKTLKQSNQVKAVHTEPRYLLTIQEPGKPPRRHVLDAPLSIGSGPGVGLHLEDEHVSALHCRLEPLPAAIRVVDEDSKNGVRVGDSVMEVGTVAPGAVLRIGETEIRTAHVEEEAPAAFEGLLGRDPAMQRVFQLVERVAQSTIPVLIIGESGTGKELVAAAIHARSARRAGPFVTVNCGALTNTLAESELFGHVKGAFTGADKDYRGPFERAHGGTVFLDELAELTAANQAKLLRVLETGQIQRVGDEKTRPVDFRIVAATNVNVLQAARDGEFRQDLFYRLGVALVQLPPLRARLGDLKLLRDHFMALYAPPRERITFSEAAMKKLASHDWPGNVREVRNVVHRALFERDGNVIEERHVRFDDEVLGMEVEPVQESDALEWRDKTMIQLTTEIVRRTLSENGGNATAACRKLGVSRNFLNARVSAGKSSKGSGSTDA